MPNLIVRRWLCQKLAALVIAKTRKETYSEPCRLTTPRLIDFREVIRSPDLFHRQNGRGSAAAGGRDSNPRESGDVSRFPFFPFIRGAVCFQTSGKCSEPTQIRSFLRPSSLSAFLKSLHIFSANAA